MISGPGIRGADTPDHRSSLLREQIFSASAATAGTLPTLMVEDSSTYRLRGVPSLKPEKEEYDEKVIVRSL